MADQSKALPTIDDINHLLSVYPLIADTSADFSSLSMQDAVDAAFNAISDWEWESDNPNLDVFGLGRSILDGKADIDAADLPAVRDMFTAIANSERFAEGLFVDLLQKGRVQKLMQHLSKLKIKM